MTWLVVVVASGLLRTLLRSVVRALLPAEPMGQLLNFPTHQGTSITEPDVISNGSKGDRQEWERLQLQVAKDLEKRFLEELYRHPQ